MEGVTITRHDHGSHGEYHAYLDGSTHIGRLTWVERGGKRVAEHTGVPPEFGGKGVAAKLVEALIADAREQRFKVVPQCSYVDAAFRKHPEWADLRGQADTRIVHLDICEQAKDSGDWIKDAARDAVEA